MDDQGRDVIGDSAVGDEGDAAPAPGPTGLLESVTAPEALALASLVLAVVSLLGLGLLNGSPYVPDVYGSSGPDTGRAVAASLLGAALALLPAVLGAVALRRLPQASPGRVLAGAGVLLAALAVLLRLAVTARTALGDGTPYLPF